MVLQDIFPSIQGECACGCGQELTGRRRRWASDECRELAATHFFIIKGHTDTIRSHLFEIDGGRCRNCGNYCDSWQADHIIEVREGGGGCGLENFQTLCEKCHKEKTKSFIRRKNDF